MLFLPAKSLGVERVEVPALDVSGHQLYRGQPELVLTQEEDGYFEELILGHHELTTMIRSIIDHQDSILPPVGFHLVQVIAQLDQE